MMHTTHFPNRGRRTSNNCREVYLNSLGLFRHEQPKNRKTKVFNLSRKSTPISSPSHLDAKAILGMPFQEDLKQPKPYNSSTILEKSARSSVKFEERVNVVQIPSRHAYSTRIKKYLWNNSREIHEMARRNRIEFEAEGYDWRNVVLDEDMFVDSIDGKLIHPCHLTIDYFADPLDHDDFVPLTRQKSFTSLDKN